MPKFQMMIVLAATCCTVGCFNDRSSLATYQQEGRIDKNVATNYQESKSPTEEYVNRIAKRIMLVSERPANKYAFVVASDAEPTLTLDHETNTVIISTGALRALRDEAELAAALTMSMERLDNTAITSQATVNALYMAGYDPEAYVALQEQYLQNYTNEQQWLQAIFPTLPTQSDITATKALVEKMPQGLQRGTENYNQIVNG